MRRVLELMDRYDIKSTFLVPGHTALAYPNLIKEIVARGHELAYHGWMHEDPRDFDIAGRRLVIELGSEALDPVAGMRPRRHVAPAWNVSEHTVDLVEEFGFEFDGSRMSTDTYENSPGGVFNSTIRPELMGRGSRMKMLERVLV